MDERSVLYLLSKEENLKDNKFLKVWLRKYKELNPNTLKAFFDKLNVFYQDNAILSVEMDLETKNILAQDSIPENLDYRIKRVELSGFRGVPISSPPYGLDFCIDSIPANAVIFGNNGTGKSSIYQAIELLFTEQIGEAEYREFEPKLKQRFDRYSDHLFSENSNEKMFKVETADANKMYSNGSYLENGLQAGINCDLCFFSENDIFTMGKTTWDGKGIGANTIQNAFAKKLGLEPWVNVLVWLDKVIAYKPERKRPVNNAVDARHQFLKDEIRMLSDKLESLSKLDVGIIYQESAIESVIANYISIDDSSFRIVDEILKNIADVELDIDVLESYESGHNESMIRFLTLGLEIISEYSTCPFCEQDNKSSSTIEKEVNGRLTKLQEENHKISNIYGIVSRTIEKIRFYHNYLMEIESTINNEMIKAEAYSELSEFRDLSSKILAITNRINTILFDLKTSGASSLSIKDTYDLLQTIRNEFTNVYPSVSKELATLFQDRNATLDKLKTKLHRNVEINDDDNTEALKARVKLLQSELDQKEQELTEATIFFYVMDNIKEESSSILKVLDEIIIKNLSETIKPLQTTIEAVMNEYISNEGLEVVIQAPVINEKENIKRDLSIMLNRKTDNKVIDPSIYFNTYSYKLFCFTINMGLLLAYRKQYAINLPIVIDDAFYSSDYVNIVLFQRTIGNIIEAFDKHTPDMRTQLILFTHDIDIFTSASYALRDSVKETILIRLFRVEDATKSDNYMNLGYRLRSHSNYYSNMNNKDGV